MSATLPVRPQQVIRVATTDELRALTARYVIQGYVVVTQDATSALLIKRKQFNMIWAVIAFFFCVLPLLVYLIYYAFQSDQVVQIVLAPQAAAPQTQLISPDGKFYWDGAAWQPMEQDNPDTGADPTHEPA